ncbi:unnamed protein product [Meganyctiphanes norvegica]|uniref:Uncharacterized protein n=1 Tax=Meganyctiphanes norvegica TaxID=48144 RepID=A0AAV2RZ65_MEGNR
MPAVTTRASKPTTSLHTPNTRDVHCHRSSGTNTMASEPETTSHMPTTRLTVHCHHRNGSTVASGMGRNSKALSRPGVSSEKIRDTHIASSVSASNCSLPLTTSQMCTEDRLSRCSLLSTTTQEGHHGFQRGLCTSPFARKRSSRRSLALLYILPLLLTLLVQMVHCSVSSNTQEYEVEYGGGGGRAKVVVDQAQSTATITPPGASSPATLIDYHKGVVIYLLGEECLVGRLRTHHDQSWQEQKRQLQRATGNNSQRIPAIHHAVRQHSNPTLYVGDMIKPTQVRSVVGRRLFSWCSGRPTWRLSTRRPRLPTYSDYIRSYNQNLTMRQNTGDVHRGKRSVTESKQASKRESRRVSTENGRRQRRRRHRSTGRKRHNKRGLGSGGKKDRTKKRRRRRNQTQSQANKPQNDAPVILDIPPSQLPEENDPYPSTNFIRSDKDAQKIKHYESFFSDTTPKPIIIETNNTGETKHLVNVTEKKTRTRKGSRRKSKPIAIPETIIRDGQIFYRHDAKAEKSKNTGQNKRYTDLEDFVSDGSSYRPSYNSDSSKYANNGIVDTQRTHRFSSGTQGASSNNVPSSRWNQINGNNDRKVTNIQRNTPQLLANNGRSSHLDTTLHRQPEQIAHGRTAHGNVIDHQQQPNSNAFDFYPGPSQTQAQVVSSGGRSHATAGSVLGRGPATSVEGSSAAGGHFSAQAQSIGSQGEITQTHVLGDVMGVQGSASNQGFGHKTHTHVTMGNHPEILSTHTDDQGMTVSSKVQTGRHGGTVIAMAHGHGNSNTESHLDFTPHNNGFQSRNSNGMSSGHGTASITTSSLGTASKSSYDGEVPGGIFTGTAEAGMIQGRTSNSRFSHLNENDLEFSQNNMVMHGDITRNQKVSGHSDTNNMIGSIMETVHTPDMDTKISSFPVTGGSFTVGGIIDQGGLSGGSGTPPRESEIENIASLNNEELPEGGSSQGVSNEGIVGLATYSRGQVGSPPGPGELTGDDDNNSNDHDYLNEYLNRYGNDVFDSNYESGMLSREQTPYIDLGPEIEGLEPLGDVTSNDQGHRQFHPRHQLPSNTGTDQSNFQSPDNNFNQSLIYIPDEEAIPHIMSQGNQEHHGNHNLQNQWQEQSYQPWEHDTLKPYQSQDYENTYNYENGYIPQDVAELQANIQRESNQQAVHSEYLTEEQLQRQWEEQHLGVRHEQPNDIPENHISSTMGNEDLFKSTTALPQMIQTISSQRQIEQQRDQFTEELHEEQSSAQTNHSVVLGHILPQSRPSFTRPQHSNTQSQTSLSEAVSSSSAIQHQRQSIHLTETNALTNNTTIARPDVDNIATQDLGTRETLAPVSPGKPDVNVVFANKMGGEVDQSLLYQRPGKPIQPGEMIPGAPGYRVPAGFRGRVILGHNLPTQAESRKVVQGFNTHVKLSPQNPPSNMPIFASVSGPEASQFLPGSENRQGLHVTLSNGGYQPNMPSSSSSFSSSMSHSSLSNGMPQTSMSGMHNIPSFQRTVNSMPNMNKSWNNQNVGNSWNNNDNNRKSMNNGMMTGGKSWSNSWSSRSSWSSRRGGGNGNSNRQNDGSCGYFVMSCYMVYGPYNQSEVCKPKLVSEDCCC